jgi:hypothetical protein
MDNLNPEQIQGMIELLQKMLVSQSPNTGETEKKQNKTSKPRRQTKNKTQPQKKNQRENRFDSMLEANMHKEDIAIDKKLITQAATPRTRKFNFVKVSCRVCGKSEEVNPSLIRDSLDRYRCNKCCTGAGR